MKSPIPYTYDLNTKSAQKVICVTHTDDNSVDVIQLHVVQNGAIIDFSGNTIIARMVMSRTHELLSDNVVCTIDEATKDIMIPIDRKAVSTRRGLMLIEVSVRGVLPQKLTLQFPLLVRVNGSILDDAEVTPESQGTVPELLIAAAEELRRVQGFITSDDVYDILDSTLQGAQNVAPSLYVKRKGDNYALVYEDSDDVLHELFDFSNLPNGTSDYTDLQNKPQINSYTLSGNKSSDDLGLQKKLTAGTNITIANDGTISASGGVTSYDDLNDKPQINGNTLSGNKTSGELGLQDTLTAGQNISINNGEISASTGIIDRYGVQYPIVSNRPWEINGEEFYISENQYALSISLGSVPLKYNSSGFAADTISNFNGHILPNQFSFIDQFSYAGYLPPNAKGGSLVRLRIQATKYADIILTTDCNLYVRIFNNSDQTVPVWTKIGGSSQLVSGVVNQNGTITFTNSDGTTFTTSGSSVIGADGFSPTATVTQTASGATVSITDKSGTTTANISNGADGQDYVLTSQDKTDIANIVLQLLPTTQGVLYGD